MPERANLRPAHDARRSGHTASASRQARRRPHLGPAVAPRRAGAGRSRIRRRRPVSTRTGRDSRASVSMPGGSASQSSQQPGWRARPRCGSACGPCARCASRRCGATGRRCDSGATGRCHHPTRRTARRPRRRQGAPVAAAAGRSARAPDRRKRPATGPHSSIRGTGRTESG